MTTVIEQSSSALDTALTRAADILVNARLGLITGHGSDVAGMRAALKLAAHIGGAVDFCRAPNLHSLTADKGLMFTTPREARTRADVLLLVGPEAGRSATLKQVLAGSPTLSAGVGTPREVLWLCPGGAANALGADEARLLGGDVAALPGILAVLNACVIGRPIPAGGYGGLSREGIEDIAGRMITSRFGVIAFSPADLGPLGVESLMALAGALNKGTRVTTLPLGQGAITDAGQQTAALVASWTTGFPPRTGFARGFPEYDPWRFDAARMVSAGECDAIVWLSSFEAAAPGWRTDARLIAITAPNATFAKPPTVQIETAVPGKDFSAEFYSEAMQALVHNEAEGAPEAPALPTPAVVLGGILSKLALSGEVDTGSPLAKARQTKS
ncbi:MAG: hypothetical protein P8Y36_00170 [Alphaproteobacteria bacterium]